MKGPRPPRVQLAIYLHPFQFSQHLQIVSLPDGIQTSFCFVEALINAVGHIGDVGITA